MPTFRRTLLRAVIAALLINVAGLWMVTYLQQQRLEKIQAQHQALQAEVETVVGTPVIITPTPIFTSPTESVLPSTKPTAPYLQLTNEVTALEKRVSALEAAPSPTPTQSTTQTTTVQPSPSTKEVVVFMGSGSSYDTSWQTIQGASVVLDPADYPNLRAVQFEAGLSILGGVASARLVNQSTGAIFYQSEVTHNTSTATWKNSSEFVLSSGQNTYVVQIRSSSGEAVQLVGARLRLRMR